MSFIIAVHVSEGIVLASDSRTTYNDTETDAIGKPVTKLGVHYSDSSYKTFLTRSGVGISTCGNFSIQGKSIASYIEDFIARHQDKNVDEIKDLLLAYFQNIAPTLDTVFLVAGYMNTPDGAPVSTLYRLTTKDQKIEKIDTSLCGAIWNGETDVMSRILTTLYLKRDGNYVKHSEYGILWNYFTLQDAIDFAKYAVQATIDTIRFQKRVKTVGGPIDILVIKPTGALWIARKELHG